MFFRNDRRRARENPVGSLKTVKTGVLLVSLFVAVVTAWGYGPTGHRVVARIAEKHLSPEAKAGVESILGKESLVDVSVWADFIKSDPNWKHANPWHYINFPDGSDYASSKKNPEGDAYVKTKEFIEVLRDGDATREEKAIALKFIVHLVGDLHQPLHVGREKDRGGNDVDAEWFGHDTNAHRIWDSELIDSADYSFSEYADSIDQRIDVEIEQGPEPDLDLWVKESAALRKAAYDVPGPGFGGTYRYIFDNRALVEQRLKAGGLRLALLLEYALGDTEQWEGMPLALHWMRNSAEYQALVRQVYFEAGEELEELYESGALDGKTWGVTLDADETVLDNSLHEKERAGSPFNSKEWDDWCRKESAPAVPGSIAFIKRVKELGGKVAIVSNRSVRVQKETESNLRKLGVDFDVVLLKDELSNKQPRWDLITSGKAKEGLGPVELVMYFGDNIYDFPGMDQDLADVEKESAFSQFGERYFLLPNPTYGSWVKKPRE